MGIHLIERINQKFSLETLEELRKYLGNGIAYRFSGRNDQNRYWTRVHYYPKIPESINYDFFLTEIMGIIKEDPKQGLKHFVITKHNKGLSIEHDLENNELIKKIEEFFLSLN